MPATRIEQIDELIGLARDEGIASAVLARMEHDAEIRPARTNEVRRALQLARTEARRTAELVQRARARLLEALS